MLCNDTIIQCFKLVIDDLIHNRQLSTAKAYGRLLDAEYNLQGYLQRYVFKRRIVHMNDLYRQIPKPEFTRDFVSVYLGGFYKYKYKLERSPLVQRYFVRARQAYKCDCSSDYDKVTVQWCFEQEDKSETEFEVFSKEISNITHLGTITCYVYFGTEQAKDYPCIFG